MQPFLKANIVWLSAFLITSLITINSRAIISDLHCDPKFACSCSLTCLSIQIFICAAMHSLAFSLAYWFVGKGNFQKIDKRQVYMFSLVSSLLGFFISAFPALTFIILVAGHGDYLINVINWIPISFAVSLLTIGVAKLYNSPRKAQ